MTVLLMILTIVYASMILVLRIGLSRIHTPSINDEPFISVIIAARNEAENLDNLFTALTLQTYPMDRFEILLVDDRSNDETAQIAFGWQTGLHNLRVVRVKTDYSELVGKKNALTQGIIKAKYEWLLFTDADCRPVPTWIETMSRHFQDDIDLVIGHASFVLPRQNTLLARLRQVERLAMSAIYAGGAGLNLGIGATGRNLAYRKSLFERVNGFEGIGQIRSGDDDLYVQKSTRVGGARLAFDLTAASRVWTDSPPTLAGMKEQEKRRFSKIGIYPGWLLSACAIAATYLIVLSGMTLYLIKDPNYLWFIVLSIVAKLAADWTLLQAAATRLEERLSAGIFLLTEALHPLYLLVFAGLGQLTHYTWKDTSKTILV